MKHICTWVVVVCRYSLSLSLSLSLSPCKTHDHYANCTNLHSSSSCKIGFQLLYTNMLRIQNHLQLVKWCKQSHESRDQRQKPRGGGRQRQPERFRAWEASHISTWTHKSENMESKISDHTISIMGVRFWWPIKPLRNGYKWTSTQMQRKVFQKKGPRLETIIDYFCNSYNITSTSVVGRMRRVVHLNAYSSPKSLSLEALDVTVKFVLIPTNILYNCWKITNKWIETPPITQNCSLLHH
jgi:hypothetical protein